MPNSTSRTGRDADIGDSTAISLDGVPHPSLAGRSLLTLQNHSPEGVAAVLDLADALRRAKGEWPRALHGKVVALIFERPSTRTRVSFESGIARLGGSSLALAARDLQLGRGETVEDTAKVLGRMVDGIVLRTGAHENLVELDRHADVPVFNGLTYDHHPCQALADAMTIRDRVGRLDGVRTAYVGDGNNVCASLMVVGALTGMEVVAACPEGYDPDPAIVAWADAAGRERGGGARVVRDPAEAVAGARAIYTDTWVSMGDEESADERRRTLDPYRLDDALLDAAGEGAFALHCLPAHHGEEITHAVLHGPRSAVWDQAENRMHAQASLLVHALWRP